MSIRKL